MLVSRSVCLQCVRASGGVYVRELLQLMKPETKCQSASQGESETIYQGCFIGSKPAQVSCISPSGVAPPTSSLHRIHTAATTQQQSQCYVIDLIVDRT